MSRPRRCGRDIHGVLLLDKPSGLSSNNALQKVKRLYNANRAGHTGALDPLATGMLPLCLGEATKFSRFLLDSDKCYHVVAHMGQRTDTSDAEGAIISEREVNFTQRQLDDALDSFRGETQQIPSMYSALKYKGKKLYEYARRGIEVPRKSRSITIHELKFIGWESFRIELEILCSKGTYIRTIVDDLGEKLGCGAHVMSLRRLRVATYPAERMITMKKLYELFAQSEEQGIEPRSLLDPLLLSVGSACEGFPEVNLPSVAAGYIKRGQSVQASGALTGGMVRITEGEAHKFIGVGKIDDSRIVPCRLIAEHID